MFTQTFVNGAGNSNKLLTLLFSLSLQIAVLCALVLIPLVYTHALPTAQLKDLLIAPSPPPTALPKPPVSIAPSKPVVRRLNASQLVAPVAIPHRVNQMTDTAPAPDIRVFGSSPDTNAGNNSIMGVIGSTAGNSTPPPVSAPPEPKRVNRPVRIGTLSESNLIRKVQPVYPPLARSARIQGTVEFRAIISKEGSIENLQLVHGHPLLVNAARDAVLRWKYKPTILDGQPVEVITDIIVTFTLTQ